MNVGAESDPLVVFEAWYAENARTVPKHPDAMTLASVGPHGRPSLRTVLLKGVVAGRFRFFTNYESRKARELEQNPHAALLFHWPALERQVRVEGRVERVPSADSDEYFATRPRESQLSALISPQSRPISRDELVRLRQRATPHQRQLGTGVIGPAEPHERDAQDLASMLALDELVGVRARAQYARNGRDAGFDARVEPRRFCEGAARVPLDDPEVGSHAPGEQDRFFDHARVDALHRDDDGEQEPHAGGRPDEPAEVSPHVAQREVQPALQRRPGSSEAPGVFATRTTSPSDSPSSTSTWSRPVSPSRGRATAMRPRRSTST